MEVSVLPGPESNRALEWRAVSFKATLGKRGAIGKCRRLSRNTARVYSFRDQSVEKV